MAENSCCNGAEAGRQGRAYETEARRLHCLRNPSGVVPISGRWEWLRRWGLSALVLLAVAYGSLLPFRFDAARLSPERFSNETLALRATSLEDVAVNVALYAVLSVILCGFRTQNKRSMVAVAAVCGALSLGLEAMQLAIPQRVSSGTDVLCDLFGAACGLGTVAIWRAKRRTLLLSTAEHWRLRPVGLAAAILSCGVMAYDLVPFDFLTSTAQLHAAFQRVHPTEFPTNLPAIFAELAQVFVFVILGFLVAIDSLRSGLSRMEAMLVGLRHGCVLACLIEALQLFTNSHVAELSCILTRTAGSLLGAWAAIFVVQPPWDLRHLVQGGRAVRFFLFGAAALQVFAVGLELAIGHHVSRAGGGWVLPFYGLWLQPAPLAVAKIISCVFTAAILSVTLKELIRQMDIPHHRTAACLMISGFYLACEGFRVGLTRAPFDATNLIVASLTCVYVLNQASRLHGLVRTTSDM